MSRFSLWLGACVLITAMVSSVSVAEVPTNMNVQGRLADPAGAPPPPGAKAFEFSIWDASVGGIRVWPTGSTEPQTITTDASGLWNAVAGAIIPMTESVFSDTARWLEITVDGGSGPETLSRMKLNTVPFAFRAASSRIADTAYAVIGGGAFLPLAGGTMTGPIVNTGEPAITMGKGNFGSGNANPGIDAFVAGQNSTASGDYSAVTGGADNHAMGVASIAGGGADTASGSYSTIAGGQINVAHGFGSAIGGGQNNRAYQYASIGGGISNEASGAQAVVGGGANNNARGEFSVIGGGGGLTDSDSNSAIGNWSAIGGGQSNKALDIYTTVSGGQNNTADNWSATVGGGYFNIANSLMATIGGGSSNTAVGNYSTIAGGVANDVQNFATTVSGGNDNEATESAATVGGGQYNKASSFYTTVSGGTYNTADSVYSAIGGGHNNTASATSATIAGGGNCIARGAYSAIGGGGGPADADSNAARADHTFIGGGKSNTAAGIHSTIVGGEWNAVLGPYSSIGGGAYNTTSSSSSSATVAGGWQNTVYSDGGTIGGGEINSATGNYATVGGGYANVTNNDRATVAGGEGNSAEGIQSSVGGGSANVASGSNATVPGGTLNTASGRFSFAAGRRAKALHDGSFVWADSAGTDFASVLSNEFALRAGNGLRTSADNMSYGCSFDNDGNGDGVRSAASVSRGSNWASVYATNSGTSPAYYGSTNGDTVAYLVGDVVVTGFIYKLGGGFHIDHPLDPQNKYLNHSFVESPDMKNVYDGVAVLDGSGKAWVDLPEWFEALNRDFRYQLTCVGGYAPVYIAQEISGNRFEIAGGHANLRVSWQVTGIRKDRSAETRRIVVEENKSSEERGQLLDPEAFGFVKSARIGGHEAAVKQ